MNAAQNQRILGIDPNQRRWTTTKPTNPITARRPSHAPRLEVRARVSDVDYPKKKYWLKKDDYLPLKEEVSWQGFSDGTVDVIIENWGHADLAKKYIDEIARVCAALYDTSLASLQAGALPIDHALREEDTCTLCHDITAVAAPSAPAVETEGVEVESATP